MLIISKIKRPGGTKVTLDDTEYHFAPSADHDGEHVAEVSNEDHIATFAGIREGYKKLDGEFDPAPHESARPKDRQRAARQDEEFDPGEIDRLEAINTQLRSERDTLAAENERLNTELANLRNRFENASGAGGTQAAEAGGNGGGAVPPANALDLNNDNKVSKADAAKLYEEKFGSVPPKSWKTERILAEINAAA